MLALLCLQVAATWKPGNSRRGRALQPGLCFRCGSGSSPTNTQRTISNSKLRVKHLAWCLEHGRYSNMIASYLDGVEQRWGDVKEWRGRQESGGKEGGMQGRAVWRAGISGKSTQADCEDAKLTGNKACRQCACWSQSHCNSALC